MKPRTLIIGDIHGGLKALQQVLERARASEQDQFIFLGDYVDGWSQSFGVVEFLIQFNRFHSCVFIKGNHDTWCEQWLRKGIIKDRWFGNGGKECMESYAAISFQKKNEHLAFFHALQNYYVDKENRLFIHGGFTHPKGPQFDHYGPDDNWDKTLLETALCLDKNLDVDSVFYPKRLKLFNEIFIGHTITTEYGSTVPLHAANLWNVDTGAGFNGKLTIMDLETKQYWQSEEVRLLYPTEKGRHKG